MYNLKASINVPFFRLFRNVYLKVDNLCPLVILLFLLNIQLGFSQKQKYTDSLTSIYENLEDNKQKVKLSHQLFKLTVHKNKSLAFKYANEQLNVSKKIKYTQGEGTAYRDLAYYYQYMAYPDSTRYYYKAAIKTFKDNKHEERLCTALDRYAIFEVRQGNFEAALKLTNDIIEIATEIKNSKILIEGLQRQSVVYLDMAKYDAAVDVTLKAIKVADTMTPTYTLGKAIGYSDIGRIEIHRNNYKAAIKPTKDALQLLEKLDELKWQAIVLNQLGNAYWHLESYDDALETYKQSLKIVTEMNRQDYIAVALDNMSGIYSKKGDFKKAINMAKEAQQITLKIGTTSNKINSYGNIANIYLENNKYRRAINNYSQGIAIADSLNATDDLYDMYKGRSLAYESNGSYKNALKDYKLYKKLYDSIFNTQSEQFIEELKTKYEVEKKEKELIIKQNKIELLEERKQKAENEKIFLLISLIGALALAVSIVYGLRQRMKRNKIKREKLDGDLAFKEKELTTHALHLAHKNEVLLDLKSQLKELKSSSPNSRSYQKVINTINLDINNDNNWEQFRTYFEDVHRDFNSRVMRNYPEVSNNDLRLMSLLKMNLSSKEIANILNISIEGVKKARYRLRKKLNLNTEESLQELVIEL